MDDQEDNLLRRWRQQMGEKMKAILFDQAGGPDVLYMGEAPVPICGLSDIRVRVEATAVNRADILQRRGLYPPPAGASSILGLEAAGVIIELGEQAKRAGFSMGQKVMALLAGGGYAEEVIVPMGQVMEVPPVISVQEAAAIPEAYITAYLNIFLRGQLPFSKNSVQSDVPTILIHGGASGVGTAAISLCRESGFIIACTVGSEEGEAKCRKLGAHFIWNYHQGDFSDFLFTATKGRGADIILDCIGAKYLASNLGVLATNGKLICIGLQGGSNAMLDLGVLLDKRAQIIGSTLRNLPLPDKAEIVQQFRKDVLPLFVQGRLVPMIDRVFPLEQAAFAHQALEGPHFGKIVLQVASTLT